MARRRPVAAARHRRRRPDRLRAPAAARLADRRRPVAAARLGHRPGVRRSRPAGRRAARASSWPARRRSRSARRWPGFALGGILGLGLGILFVHSRLAERAFVPYVVASQTVPILAIAPLVVVALKADWLSVMAVATYLTFFPVTIASMRGLRAFDPRALELFRSYAATRRQVLWQLRLPTSVPYLFSGFRVAAAASVIGAIIGEQTAGVAVGPRQRDHQLQPVLHVRPGAPVGDDRHVHARRLRLRRHRQPGGAAPHARALPAGGGTAVTTEPTTAATRRPAIVVEAAGIGKVFGTGDGAVTALESVDLTIRQGEFVSLIGPSGLRQVHAAPAHRRPDPADQRDAVDQRQAGRPGAPGPRLRDGLPGAGPDGLADHRQEHRAAARDHGLSRPTSAAAAPPTCSSWSSSKRSPSGIPGSCRAGCSSASRSPGPCRSTRSCC